MIHLKIGAPRPADHNDPMGRDWVGWTPAQTPQQIYDRNRGIWSLGTRAERQRYTVFSSLITGMNVAIIENTGIEDVGGGKRAVVGRVLEPGHPVHDALIDQPALDNYRNPMTYPDHSVDHQRTCACGCGAAVAGARLFLPGHDQRAIHARIAAQWGDTLGFIRWFDDTFGAPAHAADAAAADR
ncbi:hypothetical protein [Micromonospora inositola]|uniref:Uncharacterized protein n=1 Tax=Micromonospora inositola TaxID=47865 RepID=A0A1C5JN68_9ACTN|nr:hypothetical protein [Micromonospora inositola]SCG71771.1 hypothetical protein GA0070613_4971 [Micromonospora inositola]